MKHSTIFHLLWIHALAAIFVVMLMMPGENGSPSLIKRLIARVEGGGKPHYPISGTEQSRMADFLKRHPKLVSAPRAVVDNENGFLLFRDFANSSQASAIKPDESLRKIVDGEASWDVVLVEEYLADIRAALTELRRIGSLSKQSVSGIPLNELIFTAARNYKSCSDALGVSLTYHLRAGNMSAAYDDFAALYGLAAHLDRHEYPNLLAKTVGILIRLSAHSALKESLRFVPAGEDWSDWIEIIDSEPRYGFDMAHVFRGEAYGSMGGLILPLTLSPKEKNPIWDFTAFEDAFANRMIDVADFLEKDGDVILYDSEIPKLEARWKAREIHLGDAARQMLDVLAGGMKSWTKGAERAVAIQAQMRAALELLQLEHEGESITSAKDSRLATLTTEPFTGLAFDFDPDTRSLSPAVTSKIKYKGPVELMPVASITSE